MSKRVIITIEEDCYNKRRRPNSNYPLVIIGGDPITKKWLVEFNDLSRTWMDYNQVIDLDIFKQFIERQLSNRNMFCAQTCASYIS